MEEWIEIEGSTREEAIERACNALNTAPSYLKYEVLDEGKGTKIRARKLEKDEISEEDANIGNEALAVLEDLLSYFDKSAEIHKSETPDEIELEILGDNAGLLIGKHGQTLGAIQYLVAKMAKMDRVSRKRLIIDTEQYRSRRRESLEGLAMKLASKAKRSRRSVSAEPMNATDRRILHMALADHPGVTTKSVGDGDYRRVVIVPRKSSGSNRRGSSNRRRGSGGNRNGNRGQRNSGRRSGPPPRMHDSFDAPPVPDGDFFDEEPDAPVMDRDESDMDDELSMQESHSHDEGMEEEKTS